MNARLNQSSATVRHVSFSHMLAGLSFSLGRFYAFLQGKWVRRASFYNYVEIFSGTAVAKCNSRIRTMTFWTMRADVDPIGSGLTGVKRMT
jgi:hypothetical protein